jgi:hypothetical protein
MMTQIYPEPQMEKYEDRIFDNGKGQSQTTKNEN